VQLVPIGTFGPAPVVPLLESQDTEVGSSDVLITPPPTPNLGSDDSMAEENETMEDFTHPEEEVFESDSELQKQSSSFPAHRRMSTRIRAPSTDLFLAPSLPGQMPTGQRRVRDRWYYTPVGNLDPVPVGEIQESPSTEVPIEGDPLHHVQVDQLVKQFNLEGRNRRSILKARVHDLWTCERNGSVPDYLSEVHHELDTFLAHRLGLGGILDVNVIFDEFLELQLHQFDLVLRENKRSFLVDFIVGSMESSFLLLLYRIRFDNDEPLHFEPVFDGSILTLRTLTTRL
jgi:hypothetical protein